MKRSDRLTKTISVLLFIAMLAYLGVYLIQAFTDNLRTAPAVYISLDDTALASGLLVREESLIESGEPFIRITAESGKLVSAGEALALVYSGEDSLIRASRIRELELKQQYIASALSGKASIESLADRDRAIKEALTELSSSSSRHDTESLAGAALSLSSLVFENSGIQTTEVDLGLVTEELQRLRQTAMTDTTKLTAPAPGLFSALPDGYEGVTPQMLEKLTPQKLDELIASGSELSDKVQGKIASPFEWFFAAHLAERDAGRLEAGKTVSLDFGRYSRNLLTATVVSISTPKNGDCAVVFRCTEGTSDLLLVRRASASVIFESHKGLRVPRQAVLSDENGPYVYTVTGMQAEKKYITITWETEDYFLAAGAQEANALREGNDIILTTKGLYDGKIIER